MNRPHLLLAVLLASANAAVMAEPYTLFVYEKPSDLAKRDSAREADAYWSGYDAYAGAMAQAGILRGGTAVSPALNGAVSPHSKVAGTQLGGYFVIEVVSPVEAKIWAAKAPAGSVVEVSLHRANPHMKTP